MLIAAGDPTIVHLKTPTPVSDVALCNINDDGVNDIAALCADPKTMAATICVFPSSGSGAFAGKPVVTQLAEKGGPGFFAEVDGSPPIEFIHIVPGGADVYAWSADGYTKQHESQFDSLLPVGTREPRFLPRSVNDLDNDGIDEWLVPIAQGYAIRHAGRELHRVSCDTISEISPSQSSGSLSISHRIPAIHIFEIEGQKNKVIGFLTDEFADFAHGENYDKHTRFRIPVDVEEKWDTFAQLYDITNNGIPDLVVTQTQGTINLRVMTQIYLAKEPFVYPEAPTVTYETKGAFSMPIVTDVNGDGYGDLLSIKVPFGVSFFVNLLLRKKVKFKVEAFEFENGSFPEKAGATASMTIEAPDGREQAAYTLGDFNGDGRIDVALGSGGNALRIHLGEEDDLMNDDPWHTLDVVPIGSARTVDIDGTKGEDLVIFHPNGDNKQSITAVLF